MRALAAPPPGLEVDHPSGALALSPRNQRFVASGLDGLVAYRDQGVHRVVLGGVLGPPRERAALLDAFLAEAEAAGRRVLAVQLRADQVALFSSRGFTVNQLGTSFSLDLRGFSLAGGARVKLRHKLRRARAAGLRVREVGVELPRDEATFEALRRVSRAWLLGKGKPELDFLVGELGGPEDRARRIFVAEDAAGRAIGFVTYVPAGGERPGFLHDLTRRVEDAPPGAMELVNAVALERLRADGARWLHFGLTPFVTCGPEPASASRAVALAVRLLARFGAAVYPAASQAAYKRKWGPTLLEPEHLAGRPLGPRAVLDLLRLTNSL